MGIKLSTLRAKTSSHRATKIIRTAFIFILSITLIAQPHFIYATSDAGSTKPFLDKYAANNIMFYDPDACVGGKTGGSTVLAGNGTKEKMWNYFIGKGFNDAQTAGILGNAYAESSFTITRASNSSYWGLFQWYLGYVPELTQQIESAGLSKYMGTEYWDIGADEKIPADDFDKLLQIELDFAMTNNAEDWQNTIKQKNGDEHEPEYAAEVFLVHFERAVGGSEPLKYYNYTTELYQAVTTRDEAARDIYTEYAGKGTTTQGVGGYTITDGSNVTWIGDSLTAGYIDTLKGIIPQVDVDGKAEVGKSFNSRRTQGGESGMTILSNLSQVRDVLVFALGTNDSTVSDSDIQTVHDNAIAKGAKVVIFMTAYTTDIDYSDFNKKIKSAASSSDIIVADWEGLVKGHESEYLAGDGTHEKDESVAKKFFQLFIDTLNQTKVAATVDECCDPKDGTTQSGKIWNGQKYTMTEGQIKGMVAMIEKENGSTVNMVKTTASQMANLFEKQGSSYGSGIDGLINYVRTSNWYDSKTGSAYNESYNARDDYYKAVEDVLVNGNRTIPPQIVQFATGTAEWISATNNGETISVSDRSQFKSGVTVIEEQFGSHAKWVFYQWADPDTSEGDPFGYEIGNEPDGNSTAGAQSDVCCEKSTGGTTTMEIEGHTYAFPLAGATKANYLNSSNFDSVLSPLPCPSLEKGACHHDYYAVDMGLKMSMLSGDQSAKYGGTEGDMMYFASGTPVVAFTSGTIAYSKEYKNQVDSSWWDKCGQIGLNGDDGNFYWLGHLDLSASKVNAGDHVDAGQEISAIGAPQCAQGTQAHLHIDNSNGKNVKDASWTVEVMNKLWDKLPDSSDGTGMTTCSGGFSKGMTLEEAIEFVEEYKALPCPQQDDPWDIKGNSFPSGCGHCLSNCVEFTLYFINRYTTAHFSGLPSGASVVSTLLSSNQGFTDGGHEPKNYAIFSKNSGSHGGDGHTGVVLGINEEEGKIIIGESGCGSSWDWTTAHEYSLSDYRDNSIVTYAYTDNILKKE